MKIFSRHFTSCELLMFITAYIVSNLLLLKMQQQWKRQEEDEQMMAEDAAALKMIQQHALGSRPQFVRNHDQSPAKLTPELLLRVGSKNKAEDIWTDDGTARGSKHREKIINLNTGRLLVTQDNSETAEETAPGETEERPGNPEETGFKTILFWNAFFHSDDFRFGLGHLPFIEHKCPIHNCVTTMDKKQLDRADLVMFHGPRIDNFPPPRRPKGQVYAYVQQEPHYSMSLDEMVKFNGHFNLTVTHRRDSDVWIPYGKVLYDKANAKKPIRVNPKDRPRSIVWVVSHCSTPGKREWYVQELQKYIDIDIYGDCGDMKCSKDDSLYCYAKFAREYRFYMALENNHCRDYISEKAFRPMEYNIVPIVFGGANYSDLTPPHSVIDIRDYSHPKDLARYLHAISNNEKAYSRYFLWKSRGYYLDTSRKEIMGQAFCKLCEILHDPSYQYRNYKNLKDWWTKGVCDAYTIARMRRKAKW